MKTGTKSLKVDDTDTIRLAALKRAHIGDSDSDRFRLGVACLCEKHGIKVEA